MTSNPREFDSRINLQKLIIAKDEYLNEIKTWEDYYSCAAGLITSAGDTAIEQGRPDYNTIVEVKARYCNKLEDVKPDLYRLIYNGDTYRILNVTDVNAAHVICKIKAVLNNE